MIKTFVKNTIRTSLSVSAVSVMVTACLYICSCLLHLNFASYLRVLWQVCSYIWLCLTGIALIILYTDEDTV